MAFPLSVRADAAVHPHPDPAYRFCSMCEATPAPADKGVVVYRRKYFPRGVNAKNATAPGRTWHWFCAACAKKIAEAAS